MGRSPSPGTRNVVVLVVNCKQPGDRQGLALPQLDDGPGAPFRDRGHDPAVDRRGLREIELADDRLDVEPDHVVGQDLRQ